MRKIQDCIIVWKGFGNGFGNWESKCRARIYSKSQGSDVYQVVLFSDLGEDSGSSITNSVESVCTLVANFFALSAPTFIEHYPRHNIKYDESFDKEDFSLVICSKANNVFSGNNYFKYGLFKSPSWRYISKSDVESVIGSTSMNSANLLPTINLGAV